MCALQGYNVTVRPEILQTKLYSPPPKPTTTPRPHLNERLSAGLARKLIIVSAPAGFGKTTLLADWGFRIADIVQPQSSIHKTSTSATPEARLCWLSLDPSDNDPVRFWTYFIAALQRIHPSLGIEALAILEAAPPEAPPTEALLTSLINDIDAQPPTLALLLDDYHLIDSQVVHDGIAFLIDHLPSMPIGMTLVIASRTDPPLPLPRWRVREEVLELRAADLAFSEAEAAVFLHRLTGLNLSGQDVEALTIRTEGWIAGLQMAALSMQGRAPESIPDFIRSFTGSHHYVLDYLTEEVLQRQPYQPETRQNFLIKTSILDRLSGPLCDAIFTDEVNGHWDEVQPTAQILAYLERANLFTIPLDDERCWYRYHHLFADLLRNRLTALHPELVPILHHRASEWYEAAGYPEETIEHALKANNDERLAGLIEKYAWDLLHQSKYNLLFSWIESLPSTRVAASPWLCIYQSWTRHWAGLRSEGEASLNTAEQLLARSSSAGEAGGEDEKLIAGYMATIRAHYALTNEDLPQVLEQAQTALKLLPDDDYFTRSTAGVALGGAYWGIGDRANAEETYADCAADALKGGYRYRASSALCYAGMQQVKQARLLQAQETYLEALSLATGPGESYFPNAGYPLAKLGELSCEWNELEQARVYVSEGVKQCKQLGHVDLIAEAYIALTRVQLAQQDLYGVKETLQLTNRLLQGTKVDPWIRCWLDDCRLRLWAATGRLEEIINWMDSSGLDASDPLNYHHDLNHVNLARALVIAGHRRQTKPYLDEAMHLLTRLLTAAEAAGWSHESIKILVLQALALQALGEEETALSTLARALTLAEPGGYVRSFIAEGDVMAELLQKTVGRKTAVEYVKQLISELGSDQRQAALVEPLSPREIEVLQLLAAGLSNKGIAETLVIAEGTVKKHLKNIYGKLSVHRRTAAIARAREVGILNK